MKFEEALKLCRNGKRISRAGWSGKTHCCPECSKTKREAVE
jgi:hypothetical protein